MNANVVKLASSNRPGEPPSHQTLDLQNITVVACLNQHEQYLWKRIKHQMLSKVKSRFRGGCKDKDEVEDYFYAYMKHLIDWVQHGRSEQSSNSKRKSMISAEDLAALNKELASAKAMAKQNSERLERRNQKITNMEKLMNTFYLKLSKNGINHERALSQQYQSAERETIRALHKKNINFPIILKQFVSQKQKQMQRMFAQVMNMIVGELKKQKKEKLDLLITNNRLIKQIVDQSMHIKDLKAQNVRKGQQYEQSVAELLRRISQTSAKDAQILNTAMKNIQTKQKVYQEQVSSLMQKLERLNNDLQTSRKSYEDVERQLIRMTEEFSLREQKYNQEITEERMKSKMLAQKHGIQLAQREQETKRLSIEHGLEIEQIRNKFIETEQNYQQKLNHKSSELLKLQSELKSAQNSHANSIGELTSKLREVEEQLEATEKQIENEKQLRKVVEYKMMSLYQKHEDVLHIKQGDEFSELNLIDVVDQLCQNIRQLEIDSRLSHEEMRFASKLTEDKIWKEQDHQQESTMLKHEEHVDHKSVNNSFLLESAFRQFTICSTVGLSITETKLKLNQETQTEMEQPVSQNSLSDSSLSSYIFERDRGVQCTSHMMDYCFQLDCPQLSTQSSSVQATPTTTSTQSQSQSVKSKTVGMQATEESSQQLTGIHDVQLLENREHLHQIEMLNKSEEISYARQIQLREECERTKIELGEVKHRLIAYLERDESEQSALEQTIKQLQANLRNVQQENQYLKTHNEELLETIQYANSLFSVNNQVLPCSPKLGPRSLRKLGANSKIKNANCGRNLQYDRTESTYSQRGNDRSENSSLKSFNLDYKSSDEIAEMSNYHCKNDHEQQNFDNSSIEGDLAEEQTDMSQQADQQSESSQFDAEASLVLGYSEAVARLLQKFVCQEQNEEGRIAAFQTLVQLLKPEPVLAEKFNKFIKRRRGKSLLSSSIKASSAQASKVQLKQKLYRFLTES